MTVQKKQNRLTLLLCFCLLPVSGISQQFKVSAPVDMVGESGFYAMQLTPELTTHINDDLSDLRIRDSAAGSFVPYIIRKGPGIFHDELFTQFTIYNNITDSSFTTVEIENPIEEGVGDISLVMRNTAVERFTSVSGSDDKKHWYIIDDNILFRRAYDSKNGNYIQTIQFPLSKYKYLKLRIDNERTDPLNIERAGHFSNVSSGKAIEYVANPAPVLTQLDSSNGRTYMKINLGAAYFVNRIGLEVAGPKFYKRNAVAYFSRSARDTNYSAYYGLPFTVVSGKPLLLDLPLHKVFAILIEIDNKDDPALVLKKVSTEQEVQHLVAWLEKGKKYFIWADSKDAGMPQYELSSFRDSIPTALPVAGYGGFTPISVAVAAVKEAKGINWVWPAICVAVALLGGLTYRLMKDVSKENA